MPPSPGMDRRGWPCLPLSQLPRSPGLRLSDEECRLGMASGASKPLAGASCSPSSSAGELASWQKDRQLRWSRAGRRAPVPRILVAEPCRVAARGCEQSRCLGWIRLQPMARTCSVPSDPVLLSAQTCSVPSDPVCSLPDLSVGCNHTGPSLCPSPAGIRAQTKPSTRPQHVPKGPWPQGLLPQTCRR